MFRNRVQASNTSLAAHASESRALPGESKIHRVNASIARLALRRMAAGCLLLALAPTVGCDDVAMDAFLQEFQRGFQQGLNYYSDGKDPRDLRQRVAAMAHEAGPERNMCMLVEPIADPLFTENVVVPMI